MLDLQAREVFLHRNSDEDSCTELDSTQLQHGEAHATPTTLALPWTSVTHLAEVRDGPQKQAHTLCHYPMITWNHARRDALQIFGHVHNNWKGSRNSVNAGVDVWDFMPVRFEDIARRAKTLPVNKHWQDVEHNAKEI